MSRTEQFVKNTLATGLLQIITMISGFIIPKIMLVYFGSEVNGIVTSITQFIAYLTLLEAGISGATVFSLYKPIAAGDTDAVNRILGAAKNLYYKTGHLFSCMVILYAAAYPFFIHTGKLDYGELFCLFCILGVNGGWSFTRSRNTGAYGGPEDICDFSGFHRTGRPKCSYRGWAFLRRMLNRHRARGGCTGDLCSHVHPLALLPSAVSVPGLFRISEQ